MTSLRTDAEDQRGDPEAAPMRRGDEDDPADERLRLEEHACWMSARVSGVTSILSKGTSVTASQNRVPLSVTMSRVNIPPWLWPITTSWSAPDRARPDRAPCGCAGAPARSSLAESRIGLLVS